MTTFIFDGSFMLHRALAISPENGFLTFNGQITGGIYNFLSSLKSIVSMSKPDRVIIAWDGSRSSRRKKLLPEYKKNRIPKTAEEIKEKEEFYSIFEEQKKILQNKFLPALGILNVTVSCREGDDVIYQICTLCDHNVVVISEDKDMLQLINQFDHVKVYFPIKQALVEKKNFMDHSEVGFDLFLLHRAIIGDRSDNIAGVPGVGKVTSKRILENLGEKEDKIAELYDYSLKQAGKKNRESKLNAHWGTIARNLELMDLSREEFLSSEIESLKTVINSFEFGKLYPDFFQACCNEFGFKKILNDFGVWKLHFGGSTDKSLC